MTSFRGRLMMTSKLFRSSRPRILSSVARGSVKAANSPRTRTGIPSSRMNSIQTANSYQSSATRWLLNGQLQLAGERRAENRSVGAAVHQKMLIDGPSCRSRNPSFNDGARHAVSTQQPFTDNLHRCAVLARDGRTVPRCLDLPDGPPELVARLARACQRGKAVGLLQQGTCRALGAANLASVLATICCYAGTVHPGRKIGRSPAHLRLPQS
jgi:hypothetical protein